MNKSESIAALAAALAKAQGEIVNAKKEETNTFFKSKYATLASVFDACRTPLSRHGLAVIQTTGHENDQFGLFTLLAHSSGEWIRAFYPLLPVNDTPQGMGSAVTYARRYALQAIIGVAADDDDGNDASRTSTRIIAKDMQPPLSDGHSEEGVVIPYGPLAKQLVHRANPAALRAYVLSIEAKARDEKKPIPAWAVPVIKAAEPIVARYENETANGASEVDFNHFDPRSAK